MKNLPKVYAHRGAKNRAPENTSLAFALAAEENADGFETDIQFSADNVPLLWHDDNFKRIGLGELKTADFFEAELNDFDVRVLLKNFSEFSSILFLEPFLDKYLGKIPLLLELKSIPETENLVPWLKSFLAVLEKFRSRGGEIMISSFDLNLLKTLNEMCEGLFLIGNIEELNLVENLEKLKRKMFFLKGLCLDQKLLTSELVNNLKILNLKTLTYTCNTSVQIENAYQCGVEIIISDTPKKCKEILQKIVSEK